MGTKSYNTVYGPILEVIWRHLIARFSRVGSVEAGWRDYIAITPPHSDFSYSDSVFIVYKCYEYEFKSRDFVRFPNSV